MITRLKTKTQLNYLYYIFLLSGWFIAIKLYGEVKTLSSLRLNDDSGFSNLESSLEESRVVVRNSEEKLKLQEDGSNSPSDDLYNSPLDANENSNNIHINTFPLNNLQQTLNPSNPDTNSLLKSSHFLSPQSHKTEYNIRPYIHFDLKHIESLKNDNKKKQEKFKAKRDRAVALLQGLDYIKNQLGYDKDDFVDGIYRHEPNLGTEYIYNYRLSEPSSTSINSIESIESIKSIKSIKLFLPFSSFQIVDFNEKPLEKVNIIVPFSCMASNCEESGKHMSRLSEFIANLKSLLHFDDKWSVNIIWMEELEPDFSSVLFMNSLIKELNENKYHGNALASYTKFFNKNNKFSRGAALHKGVELLKKASTDATDPAIPPGPPPNNNKLLFFVDIDVHISSTFFTACREYTISNKRVFYPIVFSLYNPEFVKKATKLPNLEFPDLRKIHKDYGFWRDFGFGMTCQYLGDYYTVGGFDLGLEGWGMEDVKLYREYARNDKYFITRTPIPSLVHDWHPKNCDVSSAEYFSCLKSKIVNEGNDIMLGMELFHEAGEI